jgi:hypothetical protein
VLTHNLLKEKLKHYPSLALPKAGIFRNAAENKMTENQLQHNGITRVTFRLCKPPEKFGIVAFQ